MRSNSHEPGVARAGALGGFTFFEPPRGVFPTGGAEYNADIARYVSNGKPFGPDKQGLSWAYQILPYLEEGAIQGLTTNVQLQAAVLPIYVCPSRRSVTMAQTTAANVGNQWIFLADYAAAQPGTIRSPAGRLVLTHKNVSWTRKVWRASVARASVGRCRSELKLRREHDRSAQSARSNSVGWQ